MPPRYARGRPPPTSTQEGAMNSIVEKGASKVALFLLALQSSFLCGLFGYGLTQERRGIPATSLLSIVRLLSRERSYGLNTMGFISNLFYYHISTLNRFIRCFIRVSWLREGAGGKPARAEAAGDAVAKKRACKLFLPPCVPTACDRGLGTEDRPVSDSERGTP